MKQLLGVTVVLIIVLVLFFYVSLHKGQGPKLSSFQLLPTTQSVSPTPEITIISGSPTEALTTKIIPLTIKKGEVVSGPQTISIGKNQMVVFKITSDTNDELSVLGYNKEVILQKGKTVILSFLTTVSGNFSYILTSIRKPLGTLQVK